MKPMKLDWAVQQIVEHGYDSVVIVATHMKGGSTFKTTVASGNLYACQASLEEAYDEGLEDDGNDSEEEA